jgi:hypothetical protein
VRRHDGEGDVARLVFDPVVVGGVRVASQPEQVPVKVIGLFHVRDRDADVVDALDVDHRYGA